jgi:NTE family protein
MVLPDNLRRFGKARGPRAPRVAFVFQGGGSLAAPQVGMVRALAAAGLRPDLVAGSSAGALNAAAFASDPTQGGLEAVWRSLARRQASRSWTGSVREGGGPW